MPKTLGAHLLGKTITINYDTLYITVGVSNQKASNQIMLFHAMLCVVGFCTVETIFDQFSENTM